MRLLRILIAILILPLAASAASPRKAASAASVMAACAAKVNSAPSVSVAFKLVSGNDTYACKMVIARQKFTLEMPQLKVWYDGSVQWAYDTDSQELNISEPTPDELLESNPFAILNHYSKAYNCRMLPATDGMQVVKLVPVKPASAIIRKAVITINPVTSLPVKINATLSNGRTLTAQVTNITTGKALPASAFIFDKARYKVSEIIDLR